MKKIITFPEWVTSGKGYNAKDKTMTPLSLADRVHKGDFVVSDDSNTEHEWNDVCIFAKVEHGEELF